MFIVPITMPIGFVNVYETGELMTLRFRVLSATGDAPLTITSSAASVPTGGGFVLTPVAVNHPAQSQFTVVPPSPTVTSVTVNPSAVNVQQGTTQDFTAVVAGTNNPAQTVTWTVTGGLAGTSISSAGVLTVAANETATTLIVRATSTVDTTVSGTASVTVTSSPPTVTSVAVNPSAVDVQQGTTQDFTAVVAGTNNPPQTVTWTVEGGLAGTTISSAGVLTVAENETATTLTVRATSTVDTTVSGTASVTVTLSVPVEYITVTTQPTRLSYTAGQALNLAGLVVTITFEDGTTRVVPFAEFVARGLTASPANGTALAIATHHNNPVTITHTASGQTATTNNLTITARTTAGGGGGGGLPIQQPEVPLAPEADTFFYDVPEESWFYDYVRFVFENDLMEGFPNNLFEPNQPLSRAMVATVLWRMEGNPTVAFDTVFSDVRAGQWYSVAVTWASENDIVRGFGDGTFAPNQSISREQLAAMLWRYARHREAALDVPATFNMNPFADAANISEWAIVYKTWVVYNEFITGRTATSLAPQATATRAEFAASLERMNDSFDLLN
jgi:hypothetical protein